ncbi:MAG TPA: lysine--tRNA ligase [Magnetospirillaceae bacterium]|nr:lysine--tRNA ligase [Magnetospirillaceae bacterium]
MESKKAAHWADAFADRIIREKGEKDRYTCASGITPSGTVHIGNFREIISTELVVRALKSRGKQVRFIYSWDDYDVFRKVPKNMPNQELLAKHLRFPINLVPDPYGRDSSYARHHEVDVEKILPAVGINPEYLYQADRYRASMYAETMRRALEKREEIKAILDEFRAEDLTGDWWPVSIFCEACDRDDTVIRSWDGAWMLSYACGDCGNAETIDLRGAKGAKLLWRIDWPMRWAWEKVDFEPAGKDHHSQGGSFDTARRIVMAVYGVDAPVSFQYDFISIKGRGGKISSSSGVVIDLYDVLEVYTPEVARYLFTGTRPNTEFSISFDLDAIKIYEDYDKTERVYYGKESLADPDDVGRERRIYEFSQPGDPDPEPPYQVTGGFRHLCNLLQIDDGDIDKTLSKLPGLTEAQVPKLRVRAQCAWNWITKFSPEDFRFCLRSDGSAVETEPKEAAALAALREAVAEGGLDEAAMASRIYEIAQEKGLTPGDFFRLAYRALLGKDRGPRLAGFLLGIGAERVGRILAPY